MERLRGTVAAALTPLTAGGIAIDETAVGAYVDFLVAGGLDGVLAFGTNGEAVLFDVAERKRGLELFRAAAHDRLLVAAHCGAQTTAETVELAAHAAEAGADAVAVIGPPYFKLDAEAQRRHLVAAARACEPLPLYVYEFAATAGYPFDLEMLRRLRDDAPNFTGLKVSEAPWERFEPYLIDGLDVFVGPEALIAQGLACGAVGAISALASALPEYVVAAVREATPAATERAKAARMTLERYPMPAALKTVCAHRGVAIGEDVRLPLRALDRDEREALNHAVDGLLAAVPA